LEEISGMKQLTQKLKNGQMQVKDVPCPKCEKGGVLVRNIYSCISIGTESGTVRAARKGYIGKARERPQQFKQVIEKLGRDGLQQTYRAVMKKLDALSPLGYSCVGQVLEVYPGVREFSVGDLVAGGGGSANHAEVVSIPENLCVKLDPVTDLKQAAYNSLGAIAIQGIRQADVRLGETCAVIGLGVIGQLSCLLLRAAGVRTVGIDTKDEVVAIAGQHCADLACSRRSAEINQRILRFTSGAGVDAVIIAASSDSLDPINFAGSITRKKGTVVVVGGVPTGFDREPFYYNKELSIKMSCSYGPGRYDSDYEDKGRDYPFPYVRWTEKRNMQAFQELVCSRRINLEYLTTHTFKIADASRAFDMIVRKTEPYLGVLIEYPPGRRNWNRRITVNQTRKLCDPDERITVGFVGAGSYALGSLLPNMPSDQDIILKGVMTKTSTNSRSVAEKFGFEFCTSNADDILSNRAINTVFIATRHDSHGRYVIQALEAGKNVFVEKPICINPDELEQIRGLISSSNKSNRGILMVGYNRRFSPLTTKLKEYLSGDPMSMVYRINAGFVEAESWAQDSEVGGGRVIGEACHFIDFLTYLCGSLPELLYAESMQEPRSCNDTASISLKYRNGSIGTVHYFANGSKRLRKEYVEIFQDGTTAVIDDFRTLSFHGDSKAKKKQLPSQNKGQREEIRAFFEAVRRRDQSVMPIEQIMSTAEVSFRTLESLRTGTAIEV
jgi:predicted dehydrogenase/threonine dehydrogenase-like Zn-dependent dehydrogenase